MKPQRVQVPSVGSLTLRPLSARPLLPRPERQRRDISSVSLAVGGAPLLFVAGEVDEQRSGRLDFVLDDESVLVFTDPAAAETLPWSNPSSIRSPRRYNRSTHT
jgi:hypothetical protein